MFTKKSGPAKVEAAFGLFTKAISDLEKAMDSCVQEAADFRAQALLLQDKAVVSGEAAAKAETAIANLKELIGG